MRKNVIHLSIACCLLFVLIGCSSPPTEDEATDRAEELFEAIQTDDLKAVYDTYGSKQWKEKVSFEAFEDDARGEEEETLEAFDIIDVEQVTDDQQTVIDGRATYATYTSDVRLVFSSKLEINSLAFRDPVARLDFPEDVIEEDVIVGEDSSFPLEGKVTVPSESEQGVPAVVFVHGSGSTDKDETAYAYKPFRDIAWGLAERGVASIRYDKRTFVYGNDAYAEGAQKMNVQEETIDDAIHAVSVLLADERVDSEHIYILGHSLGGMQAPRIAASSADVAGFVSLAGSPRLLTDIILDQQQLYLDEQELPEALHEQQEEEVLEMHESIEDILNLPEEDMLAEQLFGFPAYYFWEMEQHPTHEIVDSLEIPMYIMQGDADFQVFKDIDYLAWQNILEDKPNVKFSSYPNLNHFFVETDEEAGSWTDSYERPGLVSEEVIDDLASWVHEQVENEKGNK